MKSDFYNEHRQEIITSLIDELLDLPGGTEISLAELYRRLYPEQIHEIDEFGFELLDAFTKAAKKKGMLLDMSKHEGLAEGLPYYLDFKVYQKKPGKKCPRCGGHDTSEILRGMPAFTEKLQEDLAHHRIYIGGCCIGRADPKYHCYNCGKDFGTPPVLLGINGIERYENIVTEIRFECGGYFQGYEIITIGNGKNGCFIRREAFPHLERNFERTLEVSDWRKIIKKFYEGLYIHEWDKQYSDPCIADGEQWSLDIKLTNRRRRSISGSNAYPAYWSEFMRWINKITSDIE